MGLPLRFDVIDLGTLGGDVSMATGMNNNGQVVGETAAKDDIGRAFLWRPGRGMQDLGTLGGERRTSVAKGINNKGQVVGRASASRHYCEHAFLWQAGNGMQDLGTLGKGGSEANAVNDNGQVVGEAESTVELTVKLGGRVLSVGSPHHAFLWQPRSGMQDLGTLGGKVSGAYGINDAGQVVGWADTKSGLSHGFLYSGGTMIDLHTTIDLALGWRICPVGSNDKFAINDSGQIAVSGKNQTGPARAFLLTPVPKEPSPIGRGPLQPLPNSSP
jgi:probable HAF family extracellular repeat protein